MLKAKLIYIKDKQAFEKTTTLRLLGNSIEVVKKLKDKGYELFHIIDLDAQRGLETNFDVYNKLTYTMYVEVECENPVTFGHDLLIKSHQYEKFIDRLLGINARVVIVLPTKLDLKKFKDKERLLVGKIKNDYAGEVDSVYDLLIENADLASVKKFAKLKKRVLIYSKDYKKEMEKFVFGVIE